MSKSLEKGTLLMQIDNVYGTAQSLMIHHSFGNVKFIDLFWFSEFESVNRVKEIQENFSRVVVPINEHMIFVKDSVCDLRNCDTVRKELNSKLH